MKFKYAIILTFAVSMITFPLVMNGQWTEKPLKDTSSVQSDLRLPNLTLSNIRGGSFDFGDKSRKGPLLVAFLTTVPDNVDSPSRSQIVSLLSLERQYAKKGLTVVGIDVSSAIGHQTASHDQLINATYDLGITFPLLMDEKNVLINATHATTAPTLLLFDGDGHLRNRWSGYTHTPLVAQAIERLVGGPLGTIPPI